MYTNGCQRRGGGGILTQEQSGPERVISYFSHKLTTPQRNYHACEKETLAALLAIEAFRGYIEGAHFTLITDSSALSHIMTTKWKTASRCSRWCLALQQYDMSILHRKGKDNIVPDALSRSVAVVSTRFSSSWYDDTLKRVQENPDNFVDFRIEDGKLFKFVSISNLPYDHRYEWKLVPPHEKRENIIRENHDRSMHFGVDKTVDRIKQRYFWPRLATEVREYIQNCNTCKEVKGASVPIVPLRGDQRITTHPWQIIAMDFIGPLPRTNKGYQHILVVLDLFSKWIMLTPVRRIDSKSLCSILRDQWFFRNSTPEVIITDNASCFLSKEFKSLLQRFNIRHWLNAKYHSQSNPVERVNRTVNAAIRTYVKQDQRLWDSNLSEIETLLNSSVHSVTKLTPFFITHGHRLFVKGSDHKELPLEQDQTLEQRSEEQRRLFAKIYDVVEKNLKESHEAGKTRYNLRHRQHAKAFELGQRIYYRNMKQSSAIQNYNAKYGSMYLPAKIKSKLGSSSYEIEDLEGKSLGIWHASHLKPG